MLHNHREAAALKIERDLAHLAVGAGIHAPVMQDGVIERAFDARIVGAIQVAEEQHAV